MKPRRMVRAVTSVLALLLATQAAAFASAREVCRYTGRTVSPSPCPSDHEAKSPVGAVGSQSCCIQVEGRLPGLPPAQLVRAQLPMPAVPGFEPIVAAPLVVVESPSLAARSTASPPRLYVRLQQLLL